MASPRSARADLLLLLTAAVWGFAFVAQRTAMEKIGPLVFNGLRFLMGGLLLLPVAFKIRRYLPPARRARIGPDVLLAGLLLTAGAGLQQVGIASTTAGKAAFITGLYVVLVPLIGLAIGRAPGLGGWLGAPLAVVGLYLLSVERSTSGALTLGSGDLYVLACAPALALHVLAVDRWAPRHDPLSWAAGQFLVCGVLSLGLGLVQGESLEPGPILAAWPELLYGGALSVGLAYTLQVVAQRDADPTHASIIMSLESPIGAFGGWLILSELLQGPQLLGGGLMLAAMLISQLLGPAPPAEPAATMSQPRPPAAVSSG